MNLFGISAERIAEVCKVHLTTARRWKRAGAAPGGYADLLSIKLEDAAPLGPAWRGFRLSAEGITTPAGDTFGVFELEYVIVRCQQVRELEKRLTDAEARASFFAALWLSGSARRPPPAESAERTATDAPARNGRVPALIGRHGAPWP